MLLILVIAFAITTGYFAISKIDKFIESNNLRPDSSSYGNTVVVAGNLPQLNEFAEKAKGSGAEIKYIADRQTLSKLNRCDLFFCMTENDSLNISLCLCADIIFGTSCVLTLINDPERTAEFDYHGFQYIRQDKLTSENLFDFYMKSVKSCFLKGI